MYLSLDGEIFRNHRYVAIRDIGSSDNSALLCINNRPPTGPNSGGEWFVPNVPNGVVPGFTRNRGPMVVRLKRNTGTAAEGIYHCEVKDNTETNRTVYVGLYNGGGMYWFTECSRCNCFYIAGDVSIPGELTVKSDLNGASPQFTLTCISTGGPATTVTWTRNSTTVTQGTQTVLNDPETAQYTHTLTVTNAGEYTCTVANDKPSSASSPSTTVTGTLYAYIFVSFYAQTFTLTSLCTKEGCRCLIC